MINNAKSLHVLIIGGGVGGLALALFLKKAGITCAVYEAYPYKEGAGGGLNIAPNGMNILAALGLADDIIARGSVTLEHCFRSEHGKVLARIPYGNISKYGQPGVSISRGALYEVLTKEINKSGIEIKYNKRLLSIDQYNTGVKAHFEDGSSSSGDILIGADGIRSKTRNIILPEGPQPGYVGVIGVGGFVKITDIPELTAQELNRLNYTFGARGFFGYCGADQGYAMWWSNLHSETELSAAALQEISLDKVKQEMLTIYKNFHLPVAALINKTERPIKLNISDIQSLPTWQKDRVLLIGDAAHAVSPNAGQGASMALEDAMYLAKLLRDNAGNYKAAFLQFEKDRKPRVEKIVAEGRKRSADKEALSPLKAKIRNIMMSIFLTLFGIKGLDWLYKYKIDWE
ncbi:2-polyprenyl-6-methoxyphenol hydroxylase-like FAD-dependent oxidoreductase [Chitinophaga niastensis]|uniref:2-polyprenyl-6-methoxyphenol hydroxylase-like FAD-dependent oxidoreductase n=1 Tax=Chitinophaga niastensis TaxID=536980 RepID=A0A2P8HF58_CHINA|nr:FAD-dependent monooxygenase [Chitinophaga niastensis]PSL44833.1 2-polyprenyl-6-methoxyphenol hydroxylase-like FAD-dependent oxidoreductase [Chitinophaga niastensis]